MLNAADALFIIGQQAAQYVFQEGAVGAAAGGGADFFMVSTHEQAGLLAIAGQQRFQISHGLADDEGLDGVVVVAMDTVEPVRVVIMAL